MSASDVRCERSVHMMRTSHGRQVSEGSGTGRTEYNNSAGGNMKFRVKRTESGEFRASMMHSSLEIVRVADNADEAARLLALALVKADEAVETFHALTHEERLEYLLALLRDWVATGDECNSEAAQRCISDLTEMQSQMGEDEFVAYVRDMSHLVVEA